MAMEGGQQGGGGGATPNLPTDVLNGLQAIGIGLQDAGAPPELLEKMGTVMALYQEVLEEIGGGPAGGGDPNQPRPRPVNTQGTVAGPQG